MVNVPVRVPICVGVKVTLIKQVFPTSTVVQGFVLAATAKSPVAVMPPNVSVAVPVFVTVMVFAGDVAPTTTVVHVSEVGERPTPGPPPLPVTVRAIGVVEVMLPDTPLTVTVAAPVVAVALAVSVNVLIVFVGFGLNAAVTPVGNPVALRVTLPVNPLDGSTVIALVVLLPCARLTVLGLALRLKPGELELQPVNANDAIFVCQLKVPLTCSY
jgi:hypothetical protein